MRRPASGAIAFQPPSNANCNINRKLPEISVVAAVVAVVVVRSPLQVFIFIIVVVVVIVNWRKGTTMGDRVEAGRR